MCHRRWWIVESKGLREPKWIQQEHQKVVCLGESRRERLELEFPCLLGNKDESHQYICRGHRK